MDQRPMRAKHHNCARSLLKVMVHTCKYEAPVNLIIIIIIVIIRLCEGMAFAPYVEGFFL